MCKEQILYLNRLYCNHAPLLEHKKSRGRGENSNAFRVPVSKHDMHGSIPHDLIITGVLPRDHFRIAGEEGPDRVLKGPFAWLP